MRQGSTRRAGPITRWTVAFLACFTLLWCGSASAVSESGSEATGVGELDPDMSNPGSHKRPDWFLESFLDIAEDIENAAEQGKHLGLYFFQDGCSYCEKLLKDNFGQYRISQFTRKHFDILAINIFGALEVTDVDGRVLTESAFAKHKEIQFTPTMIFFAHDQSVAFRMNGYYHPHKFLAMLSYIQEKRYQRKESFIDYMKSRDVKPGSTSLHEGPGIMRPPIDLASHVRKSVKPLLVLFEQRNCPACDELHLDVLKRPPTRIVWRALDTVLVDLHGEKRLVPPTGGREITEAEWSEALDIRHSPSLVFFDEQGDAVKEVFRVEGYLKAFHLQSAMDYVGSGAYRRQPQFQEFISARAEAVRLATGQPVDIFEDLVK